MLGRLAIPLLLIAPHVVGQGSFVNFETTPVQPLAIARIVDRDYLLVCNTPDNSVEVYDTVDMSFVARVPVGLRPVTVEWNPTLGRFYTTNFLGDSVSQVRFRSDGDGRPPLLRLERTSYVGDEPTDIEFLPDGTSFFVTLNSRSAMGWFDFRFHQPIGGPFGMRIDLTVPMLDPTADRAINGPRRILFEGPMLVVLGQKGGNRTRYDFDLLTWNLGTGLQMAMGQLGSTNFNLRFGADGRLYVAGMLAHNEVPGADLLVGLPTGFTESRLYVVVDAGTASPTVVSRDLNRDSAGLVVPKTSAVTYPTDVELLEAGTDVTKVFVAGFGSDRIGVLHNPLDGSAVTTWPMTRIDVPNGRAEYLRSGPRSFVLKPPAGAAGDPGLRLYVLNWLNHSIAVIDPIAENVVATVHLRNDPTPETVRRGRAMLYDADLSGGGVVACASCHVDGRTDQLTWDLGDPAGGNGPAIPPEILDGTIGSFWAKDKGPLVTQTLQGLMQHPAEGFGRELLSTAPFHWRADVAELSEFNAAFVELMGMPNIGTADDPRGIPDADMKAFVAMLETIMLPPNPEQSIDRIPPGDFGSPRDESTGSGAARGLKLYYTRPAVAGRSCAHCHAPPAGSNRRVVQTEGNPTFFSAQPLESPQLRGLFQREAVVESPNLLPGNARSAEFGLLRRGVRDTSINRVLNGFAQTFSPQDLEDLTAFIRGYDWGIAPIVGRSLTVEPATVGSPAIAAMLAILEGQVEIGNAGLAFFVRSGGITEVGYYDVTSSPPEYRISGTNRRLSRSELLALVSASSDRLILQACPAGSERRVGSPDGRTTPLAGPAPRDITLEPMTAAAHWLRVPQLTKNWNKGTGPNDFNFVAIEPITGNPLPDPIFLRAQRIYQAALIAQAPGFGVTQPGHDAPRRVRVSGRGIRLGARLELHVPRDPPSGSNPRTELLSLPLAPTVERGANGRQIWVTTAELSQFTTLTLLCGGPFAPGVLDARNGLVDDPPPLDLLDPVGWNSYLVEVVNEDGTRGSGGWQSLTY